MATARSLNSDQLIQAQTHQIGKEQEKSTTAGGELTGRQGEVLDLGDGFHGGAWVVRTLFIPAARKGSEPFFFSPPSDAVRIAKVSFAGSNLAEEQKRPDVLAELLFDSFLQPVLEGIRSSSIRTRHMLYREDPFQIDLLIESQAGGRSVVVTGQLLDLRKQEIVGHDLRVTLSNLRGRVVQAVTNQFGEFCQELRTAVTWS